MHLKILRHWSSSTHYLILCITDIINNVDKSTPTTKLLVCTSITSTGIYDLEKCRLTRIAIRNLSSGRVRYRVSSCALIYDREKEVESARGVL